MEDTELRELVKQTLEKSGSLAKIRAGLRANVFSLLEQNGCFDHEKFRNEKLKKFMDTDDGIAVIEMIKEFFEFFNLTFTSSVFDTEILTGKEFACNEESKILTQMNISKAITGDGPVLLKLLNVTKHVIAHKPNQKEENESFISGETWKNDDQLSVSPVNPFSPLVDSKSSFLDNSDALHSALEIKTPDSNGISKSDNLKFNNRSSIESGMDYNKHANTSLSSLEDLPPLTVPTRHADVTLTDSSKVKRITEKLKSVFVESGETSNLQNDNEKKIINQRRSNLFTAFDISPDDESISEIDEVLSADNEADSADNSASLSDDIMKT